jgi:hypothetical protein
LVDAIELPDCVIAVGTADGVGYRGKVNTLCSGGLTRKRLSQKIRLLNPAFTNV